MAKMSFEKSESQEAIPAKKEKKDFSNAVSIYKQELDRHKEEVEERAQSKPLSEVKLKATAETHIRKTFFLEPKLNQLLKMYCVENSIDQGVLMNQIIHDWAVSVGKLKVGEE